MIILDTHALVWMAAGMRRFGKDAKRLIEQAWAQDQVGVSAISFWELALLTEKRRLKLPAPVDQWRSELLAAGIGEIPIDGLIGIRSIGIKGCSDDPADRIIVATALERGAVLVTADERLLGWKHPLARQSATS